MAGGVLDVGLLPAEAAFRTIAAARTALYDRGVLGTRAGPVPVVSIGNVTVGGTGKTPVCAWTAGLLRGLGHRPAVVMRGYGADEVAVHRELNPDVPVFASVRRIEAVEEAAAAGADCVVLDDGFQHRALARALDVVLVAAESWGEPRRLLPRGPWREPASALRRAGFVVVTRKSAPASVAGEVAREIRERIGVGHVGVAAITPTVLVPLRGAGAARPLGWLGGREVFAVTSIADPEPFASHLRAEGANVTLLAFPDHHEFTAADVREIAAAAGDLPVVMTRKDAVKLRRHEGLDDGMVLEQQVTIERSEAELLDALRRAVKRAE